MPTEPQPAGDHPKQLEELIEQATAHWRQQHDPASQHGPGMTAFVAAWLIAHGWGPRPTVSATAIDEWVAVASDRPGSAAMRIRKYLRECGIEVSDV